MYSELSNIRASNDEDHSPHHNLNNSQVRSNNNVRRTWGAYFNQYVSGSINDKPPSNPYNWPNSSEEDILDRPKRLIRIGGSQQFSFCSNFVKTSKYEVYNFLPKFILEEFNPTTKIANFYFLLICALQAIPVISNTNGVPTTALPLLGVLITDSVFQIIEDILRHKADKTANSSIAHRFDSTSGTFVECKWSELSVGDYIKIYTRGSIPADVVILSVAEKTEPAQGICYVETKSLDGETNLKIRSALPSTLSKIRSERDLSPLVGDIEMEHPNKLIESFNGVIDLGTTIGRDPILPSNVLLRGCVLRNTDWIIGIVVNSGHDTKIMMSSTTTKNKTSDLETLTSNEIGRVILLLAFLCFWGASGQAIWNDQHDVKEINYLNWPNMNKISFWFIDFFYFFLLHATFIPVSLYVSMAVIRYFQSYFMMNDLEMYYEKTDTPALVRTMTLNEELGQVSHIFSDKTGTLTCNVMDFRKASINGVTYGLGITEIGKAAWKLQGKPISEAALKGETKAQQNAVPHVCFYDPKYDRDMSMNGAQKECIQDFFRVLAICHDVIPERVDGKIKLSASNPDDDALVCAAEYFGFAFQDRKDKFCILYNKAKDIVEEIEILNTIEFTSKRKRMSVIIRDSTDHQIKILTKGADSVMMERLKPGQDFLVSQTDKDMREFSIEGLRCLVIGVGIISESDYSRWNHEYNKARTDLAQIEKKKRGEKNLIEDLENAIEMKLRVLGCTAIEDKLQDGVPDCIAELAKAGINIWVLTGDKEETAINIAVACNLVLPTQYMDHIVVNSSTAPNRIAMNELFLHEIEDLNQEGGTDFKPRALIIDGPALITAMSDVSRGGLRDQLLELSQLCKAVVGCRVSPDQKREMVHLIKYGVLGVRTLAVGDGANDVAMIQEAHIGVGIKGEEGLQAVNSSDYAIAQFRFLSPLLLKHGRYNYIRMCHLVCYMFYKNILMSIAQFWFNFSCAFSGQKYYTEGVIQLYNLLFTTFPIFLLGAYDMDISPSSAKQFPQIYQGGVQHEYFGTWIFWSWIITAIMESILLSVLPLFTLSIGAYDGQTGSFLEAGATCFTAIIFIVNFKMFFIQARWYWFNYVIIFFSIGIYFTVAFFITSFTSLDYNWYQVFTRLVGTGSFWLTLLLLLVIVVAKDIYVAGLDRNFNFKPEHIIQEMEVANVLSSIQPQPNSVEMVTFKQFPNLDNAEESDFEDNQIKT
eukprot:gene7375-10046_t